MIANVINTIVIISHLALFKCNSSEKNRLEDNRQTIAEDTLYNFDINKKIIEQAFEASISNVNYKFLQIEVTKITNPEKLPITFEVFYFVSGKDKLLLGSFSLYPSDSIGKFIVPTQGKLIKSGIISLSLVLPKTAQSSDGLSITLNKIKFLKE